MQLQEFLLENQTTLVKKWIDKVMSTYPADSLRFLTKQKDRFANPLGYKVTAGLEHLYKSLRGAIKEEEMLPHLEQLLKLRAVQDQTVTEAVSFIFDIKHVVREHSRKQKVELADEEWHEFTRQVDELALTTFELYAASRERLYQVRIKELKSGNSLITDSAKCPSALLRRRQERLNEKGKINLVNHDAR